MSDMIWNGSYTLGDSQETQITAGTGIKVTTPAAGQIQISNDETVLFEGYLDMPSNDLVLSEPANLFSHTIIYYTNNDGFQGSVDFIPKSGVTFGPCINTITHWSNNEVYFKILTLVTSDTKTYSAWVEGTQIRVSTTGAITVTRNNTNLIKIQKVVGIGRIRGN